jgi:hypothetical protein
MLGSGTKTDDVRPEGAREAIFTFGCHQITKSWEREVATSFTRISFKGSKAIDANSTV